MTPRAAIVAALLAGLASASACGEGGDDADRSTRGGSDPADAHIVVSAAASLTDAFEELAARFEIDHPGADVELNIGSSATLAAQIVEGAPVDVFASASTATMQTVVDAGLADDAAVFARNALVIAVPAGAGGIVDGLDAFADGDLLLGLCAPTVPCGAYAREVLAAAGIDPAVDTEEPDVRALLTKIAAGELDAGIVYRSDVVAAAGAVVGIAIPDELGVVAEYPIAALDGAPGAAADFVSLVLADAGRAVLGAHGFEAP